MDSSLTAQQLARRRTIGWSSAVLFAILATASSTHAQTPATLRGVRLHTDDRDAWVYPGERAAQLRHNEFDPFRFDSVTADGSNERSYFWKGSGTTETRVHVRRSADGTVDIVEARSDSVVDASGRMRAALMQNAVSWPVENLAESEAIRLMTHPLVFLGAPRSARPVPLRIDVRFARASYRLTGTVASRIVGDTLVDGQRLSIVHDSGLVVLETEVDFWERTLYGYRHDARFVRGYIAGTRLYDAARDLSSSSVERMKLSGIERRRYPDGRVFTTPVRYERYTTTALLDSTTSAARQRARYAASSPVGMIRRQPLGVAIPDYRRPAIIDSLVALHRARPALRDSLERIYELVERQGVRERLARTYLAERDTARALRIASIQYPLRLTEFAYRLMRPALDDPAVALRFGIATNEWYEAFEYAFKYYPIALARDTADAWCTSGVCALVAAEWERAREPRLRYIGLMARASTDPVHWADSLVAVANRGVPQLQALGRLMAGVTAYRPGDPEIPLPAPDASWREWLVWLRGGTDATLARRDSIDRARIPGLPAVPARTPTLTISRAGDNNMLRIADLRAGHRYTDAFAQRRSTVESDSARFVYSVLATGVGMPPRDSATLRRLLLGSSTLDMEIARSEITRLRYTQAPDSTELAIHTTIVDALLDSTPLWPLVHPLSYRRSVVSRIRAPDSTHIVTDALAPSLVARLRAAGVSVHPSTWQLPNESSGRVIRVGPVRRHGDFASVTWDDASLVRLADGRGGGDSQGGRYFLVLVDGAWRLVVDSWYVT